MNREEAEALRAFADSVASMARELSSAMSTAGWKNTFTASVRMSEAMSRRLTTPTNTKEE